MVQFPCQSITSKVMAKLLKSSYVMGGYRKCNEKHRRLRSVGVSNVMITFFFGADWVGAKGVGES